MTTLPRALAIALFVAIVAACGGPSPTSSSGDLSGPNSSPAATPASSTPRTARPPTPEPTVGDVGARCLTAAEKTDVVRLDSQSGAPLGGVVLGTGRVGVVLAHGTLADLCEWIPYGRRLAGLGYRVIAFDLNGLGSSPPSPGSPGNPRFDLDIAAAAALLRDRGSVRVVLIGSNLGGVASIVAATQIEPRPSGVVELSAQEVMSGLDGVAAAKKLDVPILFMGTRTDEYLADMRATYEATATADKRLELLATTETGTNMLDPSSNPDARRAWRFIESFIRDHVGGA